MDFTLYHPFTLICIAPTQSGKTTLILDFITRRDEIISEHLSQVIYVYGAYQKAFDNRKDIIFVPSIAELEKIVCPKSLVIFDDLMVELSGRQNNFIVDWVTKKSHHNSISTVIILHNAFQKNFRTVFINCQYMVFFDQIKDQTTIVNIAKQFCPGKSKYLVSAYKQATRKPYGYLFFDYHPKGTAEYRIRNSIFPSKDCEVYVPE